MIETRRLGDLGYQATHYGLSYIEELSGFGGDYVGGLVSGE